MIKVRASIVAKTRHENVLGPGSHSMLLTYPSENLFRVYAIESKAHYRLEDVFGHL